MKVALTGASGLIGWHLRCALRADRIDHIAIAREELEDSAVLSEAIGSVDVVVHAAGMNRGDDAEVAGTNVRLAEQLAKAVSEHPNTPLTIYINSTHIDRDTAYGRSKREAARILSASGPVLDLVLPGVFGERGRPFYNSVVSTFCHQLAVGEPPSINDDAALSLIHAQDVADVVLAGARAGETGELRPSGTEITVTALAERLRAQDATYTGGVIPDIGAPFDRALFNTLRSYRYPDHYPTALEVRHDDRGGLVELVKAETGGQMFISTTVPGVTRGNHFHRRKIERFAVVGGEASIGLRRLFDGEIVRFDVSGDEPVVIDIPTLHTHHIVNTGTGTLTTLFWADEIFDPTHPDTYPEAV